MRTATDAARVVREGDALRFHGPVLRDRVFMSFLGCCAFITFVLARVATLELGFHALSCHIFYDWG